MPTPSEQMKLAFRSELEKISGELQGFTRSGRRPIGVDRLLEREAESEATPTNVFSDAKVDPETFKKDVEKLSAVSKHLISAGIGATGALALQKANQDRKMGRAVRLQQQGY